MDSRNCGGVLASGAAATAAATAAAATATAIGVTTGIVAQALRGGRAAGALVDVLTAGCGIAAAAASAGAANNKAGQPDHDQTKNERTHRKVFLPVDPRPETPNMEAGPPSGLELADLKLCALQFSANPRRT